MSTACQGKVTALCVVVVVVVIVFVAVVAITFTRIVVVVVVVVLTLTRIIKFVVAGQAPAALELRNTPEK